MFAYIVIIIELGYNFKFSSRRLSYTTKEIKCLYCVMDLLFTIDQINRSCIVRSKKKV